MSDINSAHTKKWVEVLLEKNVVLAVFSLSIPDSDWYSEKDILLLSSNGISDDAFHSSEVSKMSYLKKRKEVKMAIRDFKPDVVHAHYASSYGLLGALSGFHPYYISAWGSDLLVFPSNFIKRMMIRFNLKRADKVIVSSDVLNESAQEYSCNQIVQIPFGVDTNLFTFKERGASDEIRIGIVKSFEHVYGIDILMQAFKILCKKSPDLKLRLQLVGKGTKYQEYQNWVHEHDLDSKVDFITSVSQAELVPIYQQFDFCVFPSRSESFGVAILEAQATGAPVIVTKVGGLMEVTEENDTALWIEKDNVDELVDAMTYMLKNPLRRKEMAVRGREKVTEEFSIENTKKKIWSLYKLSE